MRFFLILFILLHPILYGQIGKIPMQSKAFYPGKKWVDQNGININAHGGGVMFYNNLYYWYGQHMIEGKLEILLKLVFTCTHLQISIIGKMRELYLR